MAKLAPYRRIYKQDYSTNIQQDIDTLSITLNQSFGDIYDALTNQITFAENINCSIITFTTSVNSSGVPITPVVLKLKNYQKNINGIIPINVTGSSTPNSGVFLGYTINNNTTSSSNSTNTGNLSNNALTININSIKGLPASVSFTITVIVV